MTEQKTKSPIISDALLLALVPAIAYGMTYLYEAAYCDAFRIPRQLISISPTTVLTVVFALISSLVTLIFIVNFLGGILYPAILEVPLGRAIHSMIIPVLGIIMFFVLNRPTVSLGHWVGYSVVVLFLLFLTFAFPLITNRDKTSYVDKLKGQEEMETKFSLLSDRFRLIPFPLRQILILSAVCLWAAHLLGGGDALNQTVFMTPLQHTDKVVLRQYGDRLIVANFDRSTKVVRPEFSFIPIESADIASATNFKLEAVGPLKILPDQP
jgi:hypothetical protein